MKYILITLAMLLPAVVFAQTNYTAGYVVKNNGDTVRGYINYREWTNSPKSIGYKGNKNERKDITFDPQTIKGFGISGTERYVSFTGVVTTGKNEFPEISKGIDSAKAADTLFLRQVTTGKYLTLYSQRDPNKVRFFIAEPNGQPVELIFYAYYNDDLQMVSSIEYKQQLLLLINKYGLGSSRLANEVNNVSYDQSYISRLINHINGSGNTEKGSSIRFYAGISINTTTSQVNEVSYFPIPNNKSSTTVSPKIDLGIDLFNNAQVQLFVFRADVSLSYAAPRLNYAVNINSSTPNEVYEYNQYTASFTPQILLNVYNKENLKFYIDAGVGFNFSTYSNNKILLGSSGTFDKPYKLQTFWSNFPVQAGVTLNKRIEICATYLPYASYTKYTNFYARNQSVDLGVKLLLGK